MDVIRLVKVSSQSKFNRFNLLVLLVSCGRRKFRWSKNRKWSFVLLWFVLIVLGSREITWYTFMSSFRTVLSLICVPKSRLKVEVFGRWLKSCWLKRSISSWLWSSTIWLRWKLTLSWLFIILGSVERKRSNFMSAPSLKWELSRNLLSFWATIMQRIKLWSNCKIYMNSWRRWRLLSCRGRRVIIHSKIKEKMKREMKMCLFFKKIQDSDKLELLNSPMTLGKGRWVLVDSSLVTQEGSLNFLKNLTIERKKIINTVFSNSTLSLIYYLLLSSLAAVTGILLETVINQMALLVFLNRNQSKLSCSRLKILTKRGKEKILTR